MKTQEQIIAEIEATNRTISNYRNAYESNRIPKDVFQSQLVDGQATISALRWVLGENDRYD
jgi:hypothetical protein